MFDSLERLVVKIGSSLFVDAASGEFDRKWLAALCEDVVRLRDRGTSVVVVSSGAVALGARELRLDATRSRLDEKQAAAAVGQILLAHAWQESLQPHGVTTAQVLLTLDDSDSRRRYLNASRTLRNLLSRGALPVVNENDTVATEELRYGDNDRLAARVAQMISAECLVLLSDVDGLYSSDPQTDAQARHIAEVAELRPEHWDMAGGPGSRHGSGGMRTKLEAARIAVAAGCRMAIANGHTLHPLRALEQGARATWFLASSTPRAARKQWIAGTLGIQGAVIVDAGAVRALRDGRSLLPAGVSSVVGEFDRGDAVRIATGDGGQIGCGLSAYSAREIRLIAGRQTSAIESALGYRGRDEIIHRDDMVLHEHG
ncbi:MAG: glutamate 5-kinase, partial [Gammaproteobacteria bacterium]